MLFSFSHSLLSSLDQSYITGGHESCSPKLVLDSFPKLSDSSAILLKIIASCPVAVVSGCCCLLDDGSPFQLLSFDYVCRPLYAWTRAYGGPACWAGAA